MKGTLGHHFIVVAVTLLLLLQHASAVDFYVDDDAPGGNGLSWSGAFDNLPDALTEAADDPSETHRILVAQGIYKPTSGTDRSVSFEMLNGVKILGGFRGPHDIDPPPGWSPDDRDIEDFETILSGDLNGNGQADGADSYHVVTSNGNDETAWIDGFTIRHGYADDSPSGNTFGAGMLLTASEPRVLRCTFRENKAIDGAGAAAQSDPFMVGGPCAVVFKNCVFTDNDATLGGSVGNGGALSIAGHSATAFNCLFFGNTADNHGGAIYVTKFGDPFTLTNCTVADNTSSGTGGGIYFVATLEENGSEITNCIFWGNEDSSCSPCAESAQIEEAEAQPEVSVTYTCIQDQDQYADQTNIDDDPEFENPASGNYRLKPAGDDFAGSPCINAGNTSLIDCSVCVYQDSEDLDGDGEQEPTPDLDLSDRIDAVYLVVDMGAYELACDCPADLDDSDDVGFSDLLAVLNAWGPCSGCPEDFDGSGDVGFSDLLTVISNWGPCPCSGSTLAEECVDYDLGENCECRDTLMDLIKNGTQAQSQNARCWLDHYIDHHDAQGCNCQHPPPFCSGADPCGGH